MSGNSKDVFVASNVEGAPFAKARELLRKAEALGPSDLEELDVLLDQVSAHEFMALTSDAENECRWRQFERYEQRKAWPILAIFGVALCVCLIAPVAIMFFSAR